MTDETTARRRARGQALMKRYGADVDISASLHDDTDIARYGMIEVNSGSGQICFTMHRAIAEAQTYNNTQEYAEDWSIVAIVDLDAAALDERARFELRLVGDSSSYPVCRPFACEGSELADMLASLLGYKTDAILGQLAMIEVGYGTTEIGASCFEAGCIPLRFYVERVS